jgi:hypothetical protein
MREYRKIFLCHANEDKGKAQQIYNLLKNEGYIPWLDKENLLPGQKWEIEIPKAIRESDFVITLFSNLSVSKRGYVQKEIKLALEVLDEVPDDQIFIIPVRLDECEIPFRLRGIHYCDYSGPSDFIKIHKAIESERIRLNRNAMGSPIPKETIGLITLARRDNDIYGLPIVDFDSKGIVLWADNHLKAVSEGRLIGNDVDLVIEALSRAVADAELLNYNPEWVVAYIVLGPTDYPEDESNLISLFTDELGFFEYTYTSTSTPSNSLNSLIRKYPKQKGSLSSYIYFYTPLKMLRSRLKKYYVTRLYSTINTNE